MGLFRIIRQKIRRYKDKRNSIRLILNNGISIDTMFYLSDTITSIGYRDTLRMKHGSYFINKTSNTHINFTNTFSTDDYSVTLSISLNRSSRTIKVDVSKLSYQNTTGHDDRNMHLEFDTDISINSLISKTSSIEKIDFINDIIVIIPSIFCNTIENLRW